MIEEIVDDLHRIVETHAQWIKLHAAEYLVWSGRRDKVMQLILKEAYNHNQTPKYRIGIWRLLAQMELDPARRSIWESKILAVFNDLTAPDRLHAIESLAKLKVAAPGTEDILRQDLLQAELSSFDLYSIWNAAYHPGIGDEKIRVSVLELLTHFRQLHRVDAMLLCSYILRYLGDMSYDQWGLFNDLVVSVGDDDVPFYASLLATAWITAPKDATSLDIERIRLKLSGIAKNPMVFPHLLAALALKGGTTELELAKRCYLEARQDERERYDADMHAAAAYAVLSILEG